MTEVFYTLPFLFPIGILSTPATPQSLARQGRKSSKCNTKIMEHFGR